MNELNNVKQAIIQKYENEAEELEKSDWLTAGEDVRVPESRSSYYFVDRKISEALKLCGEQVTDRSHILEIGCSFGHMTAPLANRFSNITAIDISSKSVEIAKKRLEYYGIHHVKFETDDAESLENIPPESIDVVFCFSTIRFCPNPKKVIEKIQEKLCLGGIAIIDFPNRYSPWHSIIKPMMGIKPHIYDKLYSLKEISELYNGTGLNVETIKRFLFTSRRLPTFLLPFFIATDIVLERIPPFPSLAGIIMVKGQKH